MGEVCNLRDFHHDSYQIALVDIFMLGKVVYECCNDVLL